MVSPLLGGKRKATFFRRWILYFQPYTTCFSRWLSSAEGFAHFFFEEPIAKIGPLLGGETQSHLL